MAYFIHLAILISIYAILGLSLNLVVGYTGLLSVAQAAFYGLGAYVTALLLVNSGWNFFLAMLVGILATGFIAVLVGLFSASSTVIIMLWHHLDLASSSIVFF